MAGGRNYLRHHHPHIWQLMLAVSKELSCAVRQKICEGPRQLSSPSGLVGLPCISVLAFQEQVRKELCCLLSSNFKIHIASLEFMQSQSIQSKVTQFIGPNAQWKDFQIHITGEAYRWKILLQHFYIYNLPRLL